MSETPRTIAEAGELWLREAPAVIRAMNDLVDSLRRTQISDAEMAAALLAYAGPPRLSLWRRVKRRLWSR